MKKKHAIAGGGLAIALLAAGVIIWATTRDDSPQATAQSRSTTTQQLPGPIGATQNPVTMSVPPSAEQSIAAAPFPGQVKENEVAEPKQRQFRVPVRCSKPGSPSTGALPSDDPNGKKRWVTVRRLVGACDSSSPNFQLKGIDTRLIWRSDSSSFAAFLLDTNLGLDATAGYPDVDCFGPCANYQSLVNQAGEYALRVQADGGPWEVLIQEYR